MSRTPRRSWKQDQQKILQQLGQKMMAVIERYSRDNGYTLVVDVSNPANAGSVRLAQHRYHQRDHRALRQEHGDERARGAPAPTSAAPAAAPKPAAAAPAAPKPPVEAAVIAL